MDTFEHLGPFSKTAAQPASVRSTQARHARATTHLRQLFGPIPVAAFAAIVTVACFITYQRVGTNANANIVETTENLGGGFLAVGYSDSQPGFLVASALDQEDVHLSANQLSYFLAGTHTNVEVTTPTQVWRNAAKS